MAFNKVDISLSFLCILTLKSEWNTHQWRSNADVETSKDGPEAETDEILVVHKADAVASPWAVMVHPHYTFLTYAAVMSSGWFQSITLLANSEPNK